jgi:hypothetical protein
MRNHWRIPRSCRLTDRMMFIFRSVGKLEIGGRLRSFCLGPAIIGRDPQPPRWGVRGMGCGATAWGTRLRTLARSRCSLSVPVHPRLTDQPVLCRQRRRRVPQAGEWGRNDQNRSEALPWENWGSAGGRSSEKNHAVFMPTAAVGIPAEKISPQRRPAMEIKDWFSMTA